MSTTGQPTNTTGFNRVNLFDAHGNLLSYWKRFLHTSRWMNHLGVVVTSRDLSRRMRVQVASGGFVSAI